MLANKTQKLQNNRARFRQLDLPLHEVIGPYEGRSSEASEAVEDFYRGNSGITVPEAMGGHREERSENTESSTLVPEDPMQALFIPLSGGIDGLCLRHACEGLLFDFLYGVQRYAEQNHISLNVLRATVACAFVNEVEYGLPFEEEAQKPLTKLQLLRLLEQQRRWELEVEHPGKPCEVLQKYWDGIMKEVMGF